MVTMSRSCASTTKTKRLSAAPAPTDVKEAAPSVGGGAATGAKPLGAVAEAGHMASTGGGATTADAANAMLGSGIHAVIKGAGAVAPTAAICEGAGIGIYGAGAGKVSQSAAPSAMAWPSTPTRSATVPETRTRSLEASTTA